MQLARLYHGCADRNGHVHVAVEAEVAHGAAVDAALHRLELVDELHGTHLRRAGHGPGRKARPQHVDRVAPGGDAALDVRDDVHDVRVALDHHLLGDAHAAG